MAGWIKISRDIVNHWLWQDKPFSRGQAWIDLVLLAAWKDRAFYVRGIRVEQHRGDVCVSVREMCERWGWSNGKTIRFLNELETEHQITQQKSNVINTISIVNYDKYQIGNTTDETTNQTTDEITNDITDSTTNKELIKNKENKNVKEQSKIALSGCDATSTQQEAVNYEKLVVFFNEKTNGCFGKLRSPLGETRKKQIRARVATFGKKALEEVIIKASESDFLKGNNKRGFVASFDWIIKPNNFEKILSGNYDNKDGQARTSTGRDLIGSNFIDRD